MKSKAISLFLKKSSPIWIFLCQIFFFIEISQAQEKEECNCQIHGEVIDILTKEPIPGAVIIIKGTTKGTITDKTGHYHFDKICHGDIFLLCRIIGYKELEIKVTLNHNEDFLHNFSLDEDAIHLDHIEIKAQKIENLTQAKSTLEKSALNQTRGQSLGESLKQISGVTSLQTGSSISKPVIHGMHSNRVLILNNGIRQEGQQWGSEHAPEIDPFIAKKITVLKGAMGVRYGPDAIAGVVMLEPEALPDTYKIGGEINSIRFNNGRQIVTSGILEGGFRPQKKNYSIGLRMQGTFKRGGDIATPTYRLINTGVAETNYSFSANYKKSRWLTEVFFSQFNTKIGIFSGSHIGNITDLVSALERGKPLDIYTPDAFSYTIGRPYQDVQHNLLKLLNSKKTDLGRFSLTLGQQYNYRREVDILRGDKNLVQQFRLNTYSGELIFEHKPIVKQISGSVGISSLFQQNLTTGTLKEPRSSTVLIPNFENFTNGIFVIERLVKTKWEIEGGMRYDIRKLNVYRIPRGKQEIVFNQKNNQNFTATLGYNYRPNSHWGFLANINSAWRAATVNELFSDGVHQGAASFEIGDENLSPEKALNTSFTINYSSKRNQTEIHFYHNAINNFIFLSPTGRPVLTIRGAFPEFFYTQTKALFQGIDLNTTFQIAKKVSFNSKLSYLRAQDINNKQPLILIPANRWENTIRCEYKNSFASINYLFVMKQNRVPTHIIFEEIPATEIIFNEFGGDYAAAPPSYGLFGASLGRTFNLAKNNSLDISLTGTNLLNTQYRDYLNRFRYFSDEIGRNLVVRAKFIF